MRTPLGTLIIRYRTRSAACQRPFAIGCALVVLAMTAVLPMKAGAQRAEGAIGVSLVIVPPVATMTVAITELRVGRDGIATIRTTTPTAASPATRRPSSRLALREVRVRRELLVVAGT